MTDLVNPRRAGGVSPLFYNSGLTPHARQKEAVQDVACLEIDTGVSALPGVDLVDNVQVALVGQSIATPVVGLSLPVAVRFAFATHGHRLAHVLLGIAETPLELAGAD